MNIVIVGYGRMGRLIEKTAAARGHHIPVTVDPHQPDAGCTMLSQAAVNTHMVVIDFAAADGIQERMKYYADQQCSVVLGTTGWNTIQNDVLAIAKRAGIALVYGSNFSIGANMFIRIADAAARLSEKTSEYDSAIVELHHNKKTDSPSGTALTIADTMIRHLSQKTELQQETLHRAPGKEEMHIASARVGNIPGTHTIYLDSQYDTIELTHRARNRNGFALGAVQAAEWIEQKTGIYTAGEFFDNLFHSTGI